MSGASDVKLAQPRFHQPGEDRFMALRPEDMIWRTFAGYPAAARVAVLVGEPSRPGPYAVRVWLPAGTRMEPHRHPEDRIYTVISGVFHIGLGEVFDEEKLEAFAPGSLVVLPGGQAHFHLAKAGDYVTQVIAIGPLGLDYVDPRDDPRTPR
jgi:quercetin dioxygenase-like cupin family protein